MPKPIILNIGTVKFDNREIEIIFPLESYWVGSGFIGGAKNPIHRRFLQVRSENGICKYYLWTEPQRGKEFMFVMHFKKRVKVTKQFAEKHYNIKL